ncbi:hypothetical protein K474DRAFT_1605946 [Panus rudis PR-1116 ss-1]|nr:hypothetical protein K474DRAFT_1605946 [Panus rudis PR-1116 ss-1]
MDPESDQLSLPCDVDPESGNELLGMRFHNVLSVKDMDYILDLWDAFLATNPKHSSTSKDANRSSSGEGAFHFGLFQCNTDFPALTADSRNQSPETLTAIDKLLCAVKRILLPKIDALNKEHFPNHHKRMQKVRLYVLDEQGELLARRLALVFLGVCTAIAVKEGASDSVHIDFHDPKQGIAWVVPIGDWVGSTLSLPQLGDDSHACEFEIRPREIFAFPARRLAHAVKPPTKGRRLALTFFTHGNTVNYALRRY